MPPRRDERNERPHDRHEPPEDDSLASVLLEKGVRSLQVFTIQQAVESARAIGSAEHARAHESAGSVVDGVA
jgi:hypothetical protein